MESEKARTDASNSGDNKISKGWLRTIQDLNSQLNPNGSGVKAIIGKVVKKSFLEYYTTQEGKDNVWFHMGVADGTGCIKVSVYGEYRHEVIKEGSWYMFRDFIVEEDRVKITMKSVVSQTKACDLPKDLEEKARELIQPVVSSIEEVKTSCSTTPVSIKGTVTYISPIMSVMKRRKLNEPFEFVLEHQTLEQREIEQRHLTLEDETGSIGVCLWREMATLCSASVSVGDKVMLANVRCSEYNREISLNSTQQTEIVMIQSVPEQKVKMSIEGIGLNDSKEEQSVEAVLNDEINTFLVERSVLEKALTCFVDVDPVNML